MIHIDIISVSACRKAFKCAYCEKTIATNNPYTKIQSRKDDERFPVDIKVCKAHKLEILPLSILWNR